jgi:hypothetical protein
MPNLHIPPSGALNLHIPPSGALEVEVLNTAITLDNSVFRPRR